MREAAGRIIFFDEIAEGLLQFHPGPTPKLVSLLVRGTAVNEDLVALAEAICRFCAKCSHHIYVHNLDDVKDNLEITPIVVKASGHTTSQVLDTLNNDSALERVVVIIGYSRNDAKCVTELIYDPMSDRILVDNAVRRLFTATASAYEALAPSRYSKGGFKALAQNFDLFDEPISPDWNDIKVLEMFCNNISLPWQYCGRRVEPEDILNWIMQFKADGFTQEACQLLVYLKREGFITFWAIVENIRGLYRNHIHEIGKAPLAISIQRPGKSEPYLAYPLKSDITLHTIEQALAEISNSSGVVDLICIDDVIVSGKSILDFLFDPNKNETAHRVLKAFEMKRITLTILVSHADELGIKSIKEDPRGYGAIDVRAANILNNSCRVFHPNGMVLPQNSNSESFKSYCETIGKKIYSSNPLGWNGAQWCIVLDYSVPNGTLPIFFASSKRHNWKALFPRQRNLKKWNTRAEVA